LQTNSESYLEKENLILVRSNGICHMKMKLINAYCIQINTVYIEQS